MNYVFEGLTKFNSFWLASVLVQTEAGQDTGSWMPSHLNQQIPSINVSKWVGSHTCHFRSFNNTDLWGKIRKKIKIYVG